MAQTTEENVNREWDFNINLSGIEAPTGKGQVKVPEGFYKVQITDMYTKPEKPNRVIIKTLIADGPFKGQIRTDGLNMPSDANDKVRYYWRALAESVGFTPAQLDSGEITIGKASFVGKHGGIHYTPAKNPEAKGTSDGYDSITWLAPAEWMQQKSAFDANTVTTPAGPSTTASSVLDQLARTANA